jgi:hypothetical protein
MADDLAGKLTSLRADASTRAELGENAYRFARDALSPAAHRAALEVLYERMATSATTGAARGGGGGSDAGPE